MTMTLTLEKAIEVLREDAQYYRETNHGSAVQTVLDALAAEKRRADEAQDTLTRINHTAAAALSIATVPGPEFAEGNVEALAKRYQKAHAAGFREAQRDAEKKLAAIADPQVQEILSGHLRGRFLDSDAENYGIRSLATRTALACLTGAPMPAPAAPVPEPAETPVATPSPDPGAHLHNCPATAMRCPVCPKSGPQACEQVPAPAETPTRPAFDAEAALAAGHDFASKVLDDSHLTTLFAQMLRAGRGEP